MLLRDKIQQQSEKSRAIIAGKHSYHPSAKATSQLLPQTLTAMLNIATILLPQQQARYCHKHSPPCLQVERRVWTAGLAGESRWRQASAPDAGGSRHRPNSAPPGPGLAAHVAVTPPPPAGSHTAVGPQPATGHSKG